MTTRRQKAPPAPLRGVFRRGTIWWIRYRYNGHQHFESSKSQNPAVANELLTRKLAQIKLGQFVAPDVSKTNFDDLVTMIRDDYRLNGRKSEDRIDVAFKQLRAFFGFDKAAQLTPDRITAYVRYRLDVGAARATIRYELAVFRRMFRLALQAEKVARVPYFPRVDVDNARQGFFEAADFDAVTSHLDEPLIPLMRFLYLTGWRVGEATGLTWANVDFDGGVVRLEPGTTKNGDGREFPFTPLPELADLLAAQHELTKALEKEQERVITHVFHRRGEPIKSYAKAWNAACLAAGFGGRLVHDLRRTAVRNLERAGVSRSVAMKLTGHRTEAVYRRYAITSAADLAEGVSKVAILHRAPRGDRKVLPFGRRQNEDKGEPETAPPLSESFA